MESSTITIASKIISKTTSRLNSLRKTLGDTKSFDKGTPLIQRLYIGYVKELQNRVVERSDVLKQRFFNTESKFQETIEKKSLIANEWMARDQEFIPQLKLEKEKHIRAKTTYLTEFISYNKNVKDAEEIVSSRATSDAEISNLVLPLETQKRRLDKMHLEVFNSVEKLKQLNDRRSKIPLAQEFKSIKIDHLLISGDYRKSKNSVLEINKIWKRSQKLEPSIVESQLENLTPWRKNFRVAENFLMAMVLSLHLKMITSKQMV